MENFEKRMGVFPSITGPAHAAARKLLSEKLDRVELEGKPGFFVLPKGMVGDEQVFHEFECDGAKYVIVEDDTTN
jgi:hypothetical protein